MKRIPHFNLYLFLILFLGVVLRLYKLSENSLWADEVGFLHYRAIFVPGHLLESWKFFYKLLLKEGFGMANYGFQLFSSIWSCYARSEFMLRLPAFIFGSFCVYFIYKTGRLLFDERTGIIAAFMLAISPFHIYYSQEFRMYSLISLVSLFCVFYLKRFLQTQKSLFLCAYIIFNALNFYMHIATVLLILAESIFFFTLLNRYKVPLKEWAIANVMIMFIISPAAIYTLIELLRHGGFDTVLSFTISPIYQFKNIFLLMPLYTLKNFCVGYSAANFIWIPSLLLFTLIFIYSLNKIPEKENLYLCLLCLFVPIIIMLVGKKFLYGDRYLIPSSLFLFLIVARGIARLNRKFSLAILTLISIFDAVSLNNLYKNRLPCPYEQRYAVHEKRECREAVAYIKSRYRQGDVIFHTDTNIVLPFEYYFNHYFKERNDKIIDRKKRGFGLILDFPRKSGDLSVFNAWGKVGELLTQIPFSVKGHARVWLVFSAREFDGTLKEYSREKRILESLSSYYQKEEEKEFKGIILYLFTNKT